MSAVDRPRLVVECAFTSSPFVPLTDEQLAWTDISDRVELDRGMSISRRRANELDEPTSGTLSLWLNNDDGAFTRLNTSSPYYPNVKSSRLIRVRALWPSSASNLLSRRQGSGGLTDPDGAGWNAPSGVQVLVLGFATATAAGTTTTLRCADADAGDIEVGDVVNLKTAALALKEPGLFQITGKTSAVGTTTLTFTPAAQAATAAGDVATRARAQWDTGLQAVTGDRYACGATGTTWAGPDGIPVTAGLPYTWSCWASRGATAMSVSLRIQWYDLDGAAISETTGPTTALTASLQRLAVTGTAPAGAAFARVSVANETLYPGTPTIAYRAGATGRTQSSPKVAVKIPTAVRAGDGLLAWVACSTTDVIAAPSGWTYVADAIDGQSRTWLFKTAATSAGAFTSAGKTVTFSGLVSGRRAVVLEAYSGTDPADCVHKSALAVEGSYTFAHVTPNVTTTLANCWIVSAAFDRSSTTTLWTTTGGETLRHEVFTTGSGAATGCVTDGAGPVPAGTYGSKTINANTNSDTATMWTIALKPTPTAPGASGGSLQITALQFEQAPAASAWTLPAASYTRFVGHVDSWPTQWDGGVWPVCNITATDRTKLLNDDTIGSALAEQTLAGDGPILYFPLAEDSGATAAGNASAYTQPSVPIVSAGTVTDEMLEWGGGTGPGTDAQPALKLSPASATVGKGLRGPMNTRLGGDGVTGMTICGWFATTDSGTDTRVVCGADDGKPKDGGAQALFDLGHNSGGGFMRAHFKAPGEAGIFCDQIGVTYADGRTHMAAATATVSGGIVTVRLYVDGVLKATQTGATATSEFAEMLRWNIGCGALDSISYLWTGTLSHCAAWNRALTGTEISELWVAGTRGFSGDYPGHRAARIAAWAGLTTTAFDLGAPTTLAGHPGGETSLLEAFKLVAKSDGGLFFIDRSGYATLHTRAHRLGTVSRWSISADQVENGMTWAEDPALIANDVTVKWGDGGEDSVRVTDQASIDDYGRQTPGGDLETILATDTQATDRAAAYLARYREPISRPGDVQIEALNQPHLWDALLGSEISQKFTITSLPVGAPAPSVDLFIEGVGEEINADSWRFSLDASPAGFDFGLLLDDPVRGVLDSNYVGW